MPHQRSWSGPRYYIVLGVDGVVCRIETEEITLDAMQRAVKADDEERAYVEQVYLGEHHALLVDENGWLRGRTANPFMPSLAGPIVLVRIIPASGEDGATWGTLSEQEAAEWMQAFELIERH